MKTHDTVLGETRIGGRRFAWGERTYVMGVINATPDSFSGDGSGGNVESAVQLAHRFQEWGADIIDVGGESTRPPSVYPGAKPVDADEELERVIPVIRGLRETLTIPISIDTSKASVARDALDAGASLINDQWGLQMDPEMASVAAESGVPVILMHNQKGTEYRDLVPDVIGVLRGLKEDAVRAGVAEGNVILDPGIGFGKTAEHSLEIMRRLPEFRELGRPLLIGVSRKSTIGHVLDLPVHDRVEGTAASVAVSIANGADIVRVHDVREMVRVVRMTDAIVRGWKPG